MSMRLRPPTATACRQQQHPGRKAYTSGGAASHLIPHHNDCRETRQVLCAGPKPLLVLPTLSHKRPWRLLGAPRPPHLHATTKRSLLYCGECARDGGYGDCGGKKARPNDSAVGNSGSCGAGGHGCGGIMDAARCPELLAPGLVASLPGTALRRHWGAATRCPMHGSRLIGRGRDPSETLQAGERFQRTRESPFSAAVLQASHPPRTDSMLSLDTSSRCGPCWGAMAASLSDELAGPRRHPPPGPRPVNEAEGPPEPFDCSQHANPRANPKSTNTMRSRYKRQLVRLNMKKKWPTRTGMEDSGPIFICKRFS